MKLSYRDKIIALVFSVVAIILVFVFALIRPTLNDISSNKAKRTEVQAEADEIRGKIEDIPNIETKIMDAYNEGCDMADNFFVISEGDIETLDTYKIDQFLQPYFNENGITIQDSVTLNTSEPVTMEYYYYTPNVVTYPILEAADLNGTLADDIYSRIEKSAVFAEKEVQEVQGMSVDYTVNATREGLLTFLDQIQDINKSVLVTNLEIDDYTFAEFDAENPYKTSVCKMTINFYSMQKVSKPDLSD